MIPNTTLTAVQDFCIFLLFSFYLERDLVRFMKPKAIQFIIFKKALIRKYNVKVIRVAFCYANNTIIMCS